MRFTWYSARDGQRDSHASGSTPSPSVAALMLALTRHAARCGSSPHARRLLSSTAGCPVVDLAKLDWRNESAERAQELRRLRDACETAGYFAARTSAYIPPALVSSVYTATRAFHALPADAKAPFHHHKDRNSRGWVPLGEEPSYEAEAAGAVVSHVSSFDLARDLPLDDPAVLAGVTSMGSNVWVPDAVVPGFKAAVQSYYEASTETARVLFVAFAEMLGLPRDTFVQHFTRHARGTMRLMHYPGAQSPAVVSARNTGITSHTDFEAFTQLHSDASGLQLARGAHSEAWVDAPVPDAEHNITILGDVLEMFTNGQLQATRHRVLHVPHQRFSLVRFVGVQGDTLVAPLPAFGAPLYTPVTQSDHIENAMDLAEQRRRKLAAAGIAPMGAISQAQ